LVCGKHAVDEGRLHCLLHAFVDEFLAQERGLELASLYVPAIVI
jgi:hypothetical protein